MRRVIIASIASAAIIIGGVTAYQSLASKAAASPQPVSLTGHFIPIVTGGSALQGQTTTLGSFVNVSDCAHLDAYVTATASNVTGGNPWFYSYLELSPDGTTAFQPLTGTSPGAFGGGFSGADNGTTKSYAARFLWNSTATANAYYQVAASPYVRLSLGVSGASADATNITAQLYCTTSTGGSVGGVSEKPDLRAATAGHGLSYTPGVVALIAVAGIVVGGWYVQRKRPW
jgi:hypothetical protein